MTVHTVSGVVHLDPRLLSQDLGSSYRSGLPWWRWPGTLTLERLDGVTVEPFGGERGELVDAWVHRAGHRVLKASEAYAGQLEAAQRRPRSLPWHHRAVLLVELALVAGPVEPGAPLPRAADHRLVELYDAIPGLVELPTDARVKLEDYVLKLRGSR